MSKAPYSFFRGRCGLFGGVHYGCSYNSMWILGCPRAWFYPAGQMDIFSRFRERLGRGSQFTEATGTWRRISLQEGKSMAGAGSPIRMPERASPSYQNALVPESGLSVVPKVGFTHRGRVK